VVAHRDAGWEPERGLDLAGGEGQLGDDVRLLPGALIRNAGMEFRCEWVHLVCERADLPFTHYLQEHQVIRVPISHGEGNFFADPATLSRLEQRGQVVFRYSDERGYVLLDANPNGSAHNIAGIVNERGNVLGMMPHPENHVEDIMGCTDGRGLFAGLVAHLERAA